MNKEEIIKQLDKQNIELSEELSITKDKLNKSEYLLELKQQELERYKNIIDKIKILSNQVKEEAKEVENEWCYQVMKEIDYLIELKGE